LLLLLGRAVFALSRSLFLLQCPAAQLLATRPVAVEVPWPPPAPYNPWTEATSRLVSDPKEEDGSFWIRSLEKRIIPLERFESCEFCRKALKSFRFF
jgi:hypothetical protein